MSMKRYALLLMIVTVLTAEIVSGSTPLFAFLKLPVLVIYTGFYGLGALLIREVAIRRNLNYGSVLLLGAAFGVLEEGILLKSWFDPTWMGAHITSKALRVCGIAVLQPFANVAFHAVVSITAPIVLVESMTSRNPWLSRRAFKICFLAFVGFALLMLSFNYDYKIRGWHYLLGFACLGVFLKAGFGKVKMGGTKILSPPKLWVLGVIFVVLLFTIFYTLSNAGISWVVILGLALFLYVIYWRTYSRLQWSPNHYFAAAAGVITGLVPIVAVMAGSNSSKIPNFVVALLFVTILLIKYRRLHV